MKNKIEYEKKIILEEENTQQMLQPDSATLSRFMHLAPLVHAQTAPIRFAERACRLS